MVKVKEGTHLLADGGIDVEQWLQQLGSKGYFQDLELIRSACTISQLAEHEHATETGESCLQQGLAMADVLADLEVDQETLAAAVVFESVHFAELSIEDIEEQLGAPVARLVNGVQKMSAMSSVTMIERYPYHKQQIENVRKMLLAMVDDVRVVLIKLAERLCVLRTQAFLPEAMGHQAATEAMQIYAPLANRLGIGAIKWEMEDLAFRYLFPSEYKAIAQGLKSKRLDRDRYVNLIVDELNQQMHALGVGHFAVYGRSKHIHSIHRKMQLKHLPLAEIYDATAVRILVETKEHCYEVLGLVHSLWHQITDEFDDYIGHPKANGYQSLHTAVIGPEGRVFEVQIRTFEMHEQAEMGVAAHWKYKEGASTRKESHERKIEWLREVLAWHREMASSKAGFTTIDTEFLDDRVYVFTPDGDVLDLPLGVTPLDFAYHLHSEIGHRCRGAKVNGHIIPLTYALQTGDKVEILTGKEPRPSRDWINPHLNYLKTPRAKSKVLHWFKMQDYDKNKLAGQEILEKGFKALGLKVERIQEVLSSFNFKRGDDLLAALGRGDLKLSQIISRLTPLEPPREVIPVISKSITKTEQLGHDLSIEGVGNLLTHMARCCQPIPGDPVIGYITVGRGVSVHRQDCSNIIHSSEKQRLRFLQVTWGKTAREQYIVDLVIRGFDRPHLLRDITAVLSNEKANVYSLKTDTNTEDNTTFTTLTIEIDGLSNLSRLLNKLSQVPNVIEARRLV